MKAKYKDYLGFLKYDGEAVRDGFLDARDAAAALLSFDESIRFFAKRDGISEDFQLPVRIEKGSWEALIPNTLFDWALTAAGMGVTTYISTAMSKLAHNDFKDISTGQIVKASLEKIQSVIRIKKHIGAVEKTDIKSIAKVIDGAIVLVNRAGKTIAISKAEYDTYLDTPENLLNTLAKPIGKKRELIIGRIEKNTVIEEKITDAERAYFYTGDSLEETILPELKDGQVVELEGEITKGNERTNFMGLEYKGYILNCRPERGSVRPHKPYLYTRAVIKGIVHRTPDEKKPQLIIIDIQNAEPVDKRQAMF